MQLKFFLVAQIPLDLKFGLILRFFSFLFAMQKIRFFSFIVVGDHALAVVSTAPPRSKGRASVPTSLYYRVAEFLVVVALTHLCPPFQHVLSERLRLSA